MIYSDVYLVLTRKATPSRLKTLNKYFLYKHVMPLFTFLPGELTKRYREP